MPFPSPYTTEAVLSGDQVTDIRIFIQGKTWHMWGRKGEEREIALATNVETATLPVLIGSGLGHCLNALLDRGLPVAVIDKEGAISSTCQTRQLGKHPNVLWLDDESPETVLQALTEWQQANGGKPFAPIVIPLYPRLDRAYYGTLADTLKNNARTDFWSQAKYPKFQSAAPRVLFFDSRYFLCGEIHAAMKRLGLDYRTILIDRSGTGSQTFIEDLLKTIVDFKPDFILTVNHFGLDREGKLAGLLNDLSLPLASWFVDNPHLILHEYAHPGADNTAIFTYDAGNLEQMHARGFSNVHYLPLATDPERFHPGLAPQAPDQWHTDISFVGNSMVRPVKENLELAQLPPSHKEGYADIAEAFEASGETSVLAFFEKHAPEWQSVHARLATAENRLALESLITWEATRQYRLACVSGIMNFAPLIVGDDGWHAQLEQWMDWQYLSGLDYYDDLPRFYPCSSVNFNCTSRQMKGAVNQRVFDVPACGGFLLTDYREQMEALFDLETEVAIYESPEAIPDQVKKYLSDEKKREKITAAARKRILAEHTYEKRVAKLITVMRETF